MYRVSKKAILTVLVVFILNLCAAVPLFALTPVAYCSGYVAPGFDLSGGAGSDLKAGFKVQIVESDVSVVTDEKGFFKIANRPGTFNLKISKPGYLTRYVENVVFSFTSFTSVGSMTSPIEIWVGDMPNGGTPDDAINMADIMAVAGSFNSLKTDLGYLDIYDVNCDGAINMADIMMIAKYFNKTSKDYDAPVIPAPVEELPVVGSFENLKALIPESAYPPPPYGLATPAALATSAPVDYSRTNEQVGGVNEADIVQTDGEYIYQVNSGRIVIAKSYPAKEMAITNIIKYEGENFYPSEMYLDGQRLVVIGSSGTQGTYPYQYYYMDYNYKPVTKAVVYDVSDKNNIKKVREVEVSGRYISSRKIGSIVYLATNKSINLYGLNSDSPEAKPSYKDSLLGNETQYVDYSEIKCFPEFVRGNYLNIASLDIFDAEAALNVSSYLGAGQTMYMSLDNLYLAEVNYKILPVLPPVPQVTATIAPSDKPKITATPTPTATPIPVRINTENTLIYKFSLNNGKVIFNAKGEAPGKILNQFSMDEYDNTFRIATTKGQTWDSTSKNNLYVFDSSMTLVGKLEGLAPGERIYSTRFMGEKALIVTFRTIDPLFVISLKDPTQPEVLGELKIPGFSEYLHPYDENHVIGFGKNTTEEGRVQGIKLALFDITDVKNPVQKFSEIIGLAGTYSQLSYNHKALLFDKAKGLLAFPITVQGSTTYQGTQFQGAYVYHIDLDKGFSLTGKITHLLPYELSDAYLYDYQRNIERIMYIGDTLYTLSTRVIKANDMATLKEVKSIDVPVIPPVLITPVPPTVPVPQVTPTPASMQ